VQSAAWSEDELIRESAPVAEETDESAARSPAILPDVRK
jgi:hypothetical protein